MTTITKLNTCFFCGSEQPDHHHYTVLCYEGERCLGRLSSDGHTTRRRIHAVMLGKDRANEIAAEINAEGVFSAKVKRF